MKLKNKNIYTIIGFILFSQLAFAQSGFIGKKHEASLDISSAIFGTVGGSYKYSYSKRSAMIIDLGYMNKSKEKMNNSTKLNSFVPAAKFNGIMVGIGILWNSKSAGMNMPIGYYTGFSIDYVKGKLANTVPRRQLSETLEWKQYDYNGYISSFSRDGATNARDIEYTFNTSGYHFNFYYGKNIYLAKNITLDLCIKWGLAYYRYKPSNFTAFPVNSYNYNSTEPDHIGSPNEGGYTIYKDGVYYIKNRGFNLLPDLYSSSLASQINSNGSSSASYNVLFNGNGAIEKANTINKFKFIMLPQIKIGYLF
ncbi:MAG: hypothetical protein RL708_2378 [Bacteroidota bacterium]|jgi:hypothetical protein